MDNLTEVLNNKEAKKEVSEVKEGKKEGKAEAVKKAEKISKAEKEGYLIASSIKRTGTFKIQELIGKDYIDMWSDRKDFIEKGLAPKGFKVSPIFSVVKGIYGRSKGKVLKDTRTTALLVEKI